MVNSTTVDIEKLKVLPEGTFGKEYTKFMNTYVSNCYIILKNFHVGLCTGLNISHSELP